MREATVVAQVGEIVPGRMKYALIDGLPVVVANVDGALYAFSDLCRHQGGSLSGGVLRDGVVTCSWHGWAYNVRTGKAIVPPVGLRIPTYAVEIVGDAVLVVIEWPDPEPEP